METFFDVHTIVQLNLISESYRQFLSGVNGHFEISVLVKATNDFLRIGIRDIPSIAWEL
ncbi:MAG: hypothetical protein JWQ42_2249 [Edaphobacter sp.]|nr:hypothetical protein [Edaphobacter sp.]